MKSYYDESLIDSIDRSISDAVINLSDKFRNISIKNDDMRKSIKQFELISGMFILGFATTTLTNKLMDSQKPQHASTTVVAAADPEVKTPKLEAVKKEVPIYPKTADIDYDKAYTNVNADVIAKAKEISDLPTMEGTNVLREFLESHDEIDNDALINTLLFIDKVAIFNDCKDANSYLNVRGITPDLLNVEGRGR